MNSALDRLVTFDPGERGVKALYTAASAETPLVAAAARTLRAAAIDGDSVVLTTGFPIPPNRQPETDGPPGTLVVARALQSMGVLPVIAAEPVLEEPLTACADVLGLTEFVFEPLAPGSTTAAAGEQLLDRHEPAAVMAIERPGRTADGTYRSMTGVDITSAVAAVDPLFETARADGIPTIAVGDGGNEIGMGGVRSAVETKIDCGDQIAATTTVDHLVVAGVSNWGAYGIVAALDHFTGERHLHAPTTERALLAACCAAGCVDGREGSAAPRVDGLETATHQQMVGLLHASTQHAQI